MMPIVLRHLFDLDFLLFPSSDAVATPSASAPSSALRTKPSIDDTQTTGTTIETANSPTDDDDSEATDCKNPTATALSSGTAFYAADSPPATTTGTTMVTPLPVSTACHASLRHHQGRNPSFASRLSLFFLRRNNNKKKKRFFVSSAPKAESKMIESNVVQRRPELYRRGNCQIETTQQEEPIVPLKTDTSFHTIQEQSILMDDSELTPISIVTDVAAAAVPYNLKNFYIRMQDLDTECLPHDVSISSSLSSLSTISTSFHKSSTLLMEENVLFYHVTSPTKLTMILDRLVQYACHAAADPNHKCLGIDNIEFQPTRETQRLLQHGDERNSNHVYTWIGMKEAHLSDSFGSTWPITQVRAMIQNASPLQLITFLFDSTQVPKYNSISLGPEVLMTWHYDNNTTNSLPSSSVNCDLIGTVKVARGRVQPKLFPKVIETLCIMYVTAIPTEPDSYMIVSRSIMEDETWEWQDATMLPTNTDISNSLQKTNTATIRSEVLLNVYYVRPLKPDHHQYSSEHRGCELTMVTHVVSTGVPEIIAKRMTSISATNMVREIQRIFSSQ